MKKIALSLIALGFICSCQNKQKKAESLVQSYLKENLRDPGSYESVKFGELVPDSGSYTSDSEEGKRLTQLRREYDDTINVYRQEENQNGFLPSGMERKPDKALEQFYKHKADSVDKLIANGEKSFKHKLQYYYLEHTYRAKNGFGGLNLSTKTFTIDSAMTKAQAEL